MIYPFFSASLPELFSGTPPGISREEFDESAEAEMSRNDFLQLVSWDAADTEADPPALPHVYRAMRRFDHYLAWRVAQIRAERSGVQSDFTAPEEFFAEVDAFLPAAAAAAPVEREKAIDRIRWRKLDDLDAAGNGMDLTHLCVYRLKLLAGEKFSRRNRNGKALFQQSAETVFLNFRKTSSSLEK